MNKTHLVALKNRAVKESMLLKLGLMVMTIICMLQSPITFYLLKRERTHIIPIGISEGFWVGGSKASASYLIEMAEFWGGQILTANEHNFEFRLKHLLEHAAPEYHNSLKSMLIGQKDELIKGLSTSFSPKKFKVDENKLLVEMSGLLHIFEGGKPIKTDELKFKIGFLINHGKIYVRTFEEV